MVLHIESVHKFIAGKKKQRPCDAPLHLHTIGREGTLNICPQVSGSKLFFWWEGGLVRENVMNPFSLLFNKSKKNKKFNTLHF